MLQTNKRSYFFQHHVRLDHRSLQDSEVNLVQDQYCPLWEKKWNTQHQVTLLFLVWWSFSILLILHNSTLLFSQQPQLRSPFLSALWAKASPAQLSVITDKYTQKAVGQKYLNIHTYTHFSRSLVKFQMRLGTNQNCDRLTRQATVM